MSRTMSGIAAMLLLLAAPVFGGVRREEAMQLLCVRVNARLSSADVLAPVPDAEQEPFRAKAMALFQEVATKVLPEELTADSDDRVRKYISLTTISMHDDDDDAYNRASIEFALRRLMLHCAESRAYPPPTEEQQKALRENITLWAEMMRRELPPRLKDFGAEAEAEAQVAEMMKRCTRAIGEPGAMSFKRPVDDEAMTALLLESVRLMDAAVVQCRKDREGALGILSDRDWAYYAVGQVVSAGQKGLVSRTSRPENERTPPDTLVPGYSDCLNRWRAEKKRRSQEDSERGRKERAERDKKLRVEMLRDQMHRMLPPPELLPLPEDPPKGK